MTDTEWTRPYYGITHYDPRRDRWATVDSRRHNMHILTKWDRSLANYYTGTKEQIYSSLAYAKRAGEEWSGVVRQTAAGHCPHCGQRINQKRHETD